MKIYKVRQVSKASKEWIADPKNRPAALRPPLISAVWSCSGTCCAAFRFEATRVLTALSSLRVRLPGCSPISPCVARRVPLAPRRFSQDLRRRRLMVLHRTVSASSQIFHRCGFARPSVTPCTHYATPLHALPVANNGLEYLGLRVERLVRLVVAIVFVGVVSTNDSFLIEKRVS